MNIDVRKHCVEFPKSFVDNICRHIAADLERYHRLIRHVSVQIGAFNGPRGGEDKSCRIQVHLKRAASVVVEDRGRAFLRLLVGPSPGLIRPCPVRQTGLRGGVALVGRLPRISSLPSLHQPSSNAKRLFCSALPQEKAGLKKMHRAWTEEGVQT